MAPSPPPHLRACTALGSEGFTDSWAQDALRFAQACPTGRLWNSPLPASIRHLYVKNASHSTAKEGNGAAFPWVTHGLDPSAVLLQASLVLGLN